MDQLKRKPTHLPCYDYSQHGAYFITICTQNRIPLFGAPNSGHPAAQMVRQVFEQTIASFSNVSCPVYAVMPDHFHAIIFIDRPTETTPAVSISDIVRIFKSQSTVSYIKMVHTGQLPPFQGKIWQRSYYDHVIRNDADFLETWKYIEENPMKWELVQQPDKEGTRPSPTVLK